MGRRIWWVIHSSMQTLAALIPIISLLTSRPRDGNIAILFLASKEAGWITGLIMPVDGGVSPPPPLPPFPRYYREIICWA